MSERGRTNETGQNAKPIPNDSMRQKRGKFVREKKAKKRGLGMCGNRVISSPFIYVSAGREVGSDVSMKY